MDVIMISKRIWDYLYNKELEGRVHSVFKNAANLIFDEKKLITLINDPLQINPFSAVIPVINFMGEGFKRDESIYLKNNQFIKNPCFTLNIENGRIWDSRPKIQNNYL